MPATKFEAMLFPSDQTGESVVEPELIAPINNGRANMQTVIDEAKTMKGLTILTHLLDNKERYTRADPTTWEIEVKFYRFCVETGSFNVLQTFLKDLVLYPASQSITEAVDNVAKLKAHAWYMLAHPKNQALVDAVEGYLFCLVLFPFLISI